MLLRTSGFRKLKGLDKRSFYYIIELLKTKMRIIIEFIRTKVNGKTQRKPEDPIRNAYFL